MFRVSQRGEGIDDADTIEGGREIVPGQPTMGRFDLCEVRDEARRFRSQQTSRLLRAAEYIQSRGGIEEDPAMGMDPERVGYPGVGAPRSELDGPPRQLLGLTEVADSSPRPEEIRQGLAQIEFFIHRTISGHEIAPRTSQSNRK